MSAISVEADSYNARLSQWEAFLEPWAATIAVDQENPLAQRVIKVRSNKTLNITLSYSSMRLAQGTYTDWIKDINTPGSNRITRKISSPFIVCNNLGLPFSFACSNSVNPIFTRLGPGEQVEWNPFAEDLVTHSMATSNGLTVVFENDLFDQVDDLPFDQFGHHFTSLTPLYQNVPYRWDFFLFFFIYLMSWNNL